MRSINSILINEMNKLIRTRTDRCCRRCRRRRRRHWGEGVCGGEVTKVLTVNDCVIKK